MANINVNPEYDVQMEKLTPETRAHSDRFNERYGQLLNNDAYLKEKVETANENIERAMAVAQGKAAGRVYGTYAELLKWIAIPANAEKLMLGDQFLIKAVDVPDYWWDNTITTEQRDGAGNVISAKNAAGKVIGALVELEARKIDLSKYDASDAALFNNMSDQYSTARTYAVGDICIYNNELYKCVTAVSSAEKFNANKWNKTSLAALHVAQEAKIANLNEGLSYVPYNSYKTIANKDLLNVDLTNAQASTHLPARIEASDAKTLINCPISSGTVIFERIVHWYQEKRVMVELIEYYPVSGRHWYNHYNFNAGWSGWTSGVNWESINGKPSTFNPATHTHDDRYYTETEINALLAEPSVWDAVSAIAKNGFLSNALLVSLTNYNDDNNKPRYVVAGQTAEMPEGCAYGIRTVYHFNSENVMIVINGVENGTNEHRIYTRNYVSGQWTTWRCLATTSMLGSYLPLSGGTVDGDVIIRKNLHVGTGKVHIWEDDEGGNIQIFSPNNTVYEIDATANDFLRIHNGSGDAGTYKAFEFYHNGDFKVYGACKAGSFVQASAKKYKKNIKNMSDEEAMQILKYRIVDFDYKNEADGVNCQGMIADEVININKYPVYCNEKGEVEGIDYSKFVPQLIKMVQIQQRQMDSLASQLMKMNEQ